MTHNKDHHPSATAANQLPEFSSSVSPEERVAAWKALVRKGDAVPEEQLDRALIKMLEEIRRSL